MHHWTFFIYTNHKVYTFNLSSSRFSLTLQRSVFNCFKCCHILPLPVNCVSSETLGQSIENERLIRMEIRENVCFRETMTSVVRFATSEFLERTQYKIIVYWTVPRKFFMLFFIKVRSILESAFCSLFYSRLILLVILCFVHCASFYCHIGSST